MSVTVYTIRSRFDNSVLYVGKTNNIYRRFQYEHKYSGKFDSIGFENVYPKIECKYETNEEAIKKEDELILKYDTINRGYNMQRSGMVSKDDAYKNDYRIAHYNLNKDSIIEYQRKYRKENVDYMKGRDKQYYEAHKEYVKNRNKEYRKRKEEEAKKNGTYEAYKEEVNRKARENYKKRVERKKVL